MVALEENVSRPGFHIMMPPSSQLHYYFFIFISTFTPNTVPNNVINVHSKEICWTKEGFGTLQATVKLSSGKAHIDSHPLLSPHPDLNSSLAHSHQWSRMNPEVGSVEISSMAPVQCKKNNFLLSLFWFIYSSFLVSFSFCPGKLRALIERCIFGCCFLKNPPWLEHDVLEQNIPWGGLNEKQGHFPNSSTSQPTSKSFPRSWTQTRRRLDPG